MSKDATHTYLHFHSSNHADLFEDFCSPQSRIPDDDIYVPPQNQPLNPEDEDNIVPAQHAAFGIIKANEKSRVKEWKDLGLAALMSRGPGEGSGKSNGKKIGGGFGGLGKGLPR